VLCRGCHNIRHERWEKQSRLVSLDVRRVTVTNSKVYSVPDNVADYLCSTTGSEISGKVGTGVREMDCQTFLECQRDDVMTTTLGYIVSINRLRFFFEQWVVHVK